MFTNLSKDRHDVVNAMTRELVFAKTLHNASSHRLNDKTVQQEEANRLLNIEALLTGFMRFIERIEEQTAFLKQARKEAEAESSEAKKEKRKTECLMIEEQLSKTNAELATARMNLAQTLDDEKMRETMKAALDAEIQKIKEQMNELSTLISRLQQNITTLDKQITTLSERSESLTRELRDAVYHIDLASLDGLPPEVQQRVQEMQAAHDLPEQDGGFRIVELFVEAIAESRDVLLERVPGVMAIADKIAEVGAEFKNAVEKRGDYVSQLDKMQEALSSYKAEFERVQNTVGHLRNQSPNKSDTYVDKCRLFAAARQKELSREHVSDKKNDIQNNETPTHRF
jgi:predicted  nucleic acid-binding Zn-ribbon protein